MCILDVKFGFAAAATILIDFQTITFWIHKDILLETLHRAHVDTLRAAGFYVWMYAFTDVK